MKRLMLTAAVLGLTLGGCHIAQASTDTVPACKTTLSSLIGSIEAQGGMVKEVKDEAQRQNVLAFVAGRTGKVIDATDTVMIAENSASPLIAIVVSTKEGCVVSAGVVGGEHDLQAIERGEGDGPRA